MMPVEPGAGRDRSAAGFLRRKVARFTARRPAPTNPGRAIVSFSFDDAPLSATTCAADILREADACATFYICGQFADGRSGELAPYADWDRLRSLAAAGHEIGCHSFTHRNCGLSSPLACRLDAETNRDAFAANGLPQPTTFAFPFGDASASAKAALTSDYHLLRGVDAGVVRKGSDLNLAPAVAIEGHDAVSVARSWLERARRDAAWLIFYSHDVTESPSPFGCTPEIFREVVRLTRSMDIEIVPVADGLKSVC